MTRMPLLLSAILSVAIGTSTLLLGASLSVQACPLTDNTVTPGITGRQPDASDNLGNAAKLPGDSERRSSLDYMGVAGLGAIAGLFAIAMMDKVRRSRTVAPAEAELLSRYPQLEHPELILTLMPQEALPSAFDTEFALR